MPSGLQFADLGGLVPGKNVGQYDVDAELAGNAPGRSLIIAGDHRHLDAALLQGGDGCGRGRAGCVGDRYNAGDLATAGDMDYSSSRAFQAIRCLAQAAHRHARFIHRPAVTDEHRLAFDLGVRAFSFQIGKVTSLGQHQVAGALNDGNGERMFRIFLQRRGKPQHLVGSVCAGSDDFDHLGLPHGQGPGLVKDDHVELGRILQRRGVLEQDAVHCAQSGADHDRHRRSKSKRIGAGNDEDGDRQGQCKQQCGIKSPVPKGERRKANKDRRKYQPLRGAVGKQLCRRF